MFEAQVMMASTTPHIPIANTHSDDEADDWSIVTDGVVFENAEPSRLYPMRHYTDIIYNAHHLFTAIEKKCDDLSWEKNEQSFFRPRSRQEEEEMAKNWLNVDNGFDPPSSPCNDQLDLFVDSPFVRRRIKTSKSGAVTSTTYTLACGNPIQYKT